MATRQTFDKTFKQEAVRLVQTSGKTMRQVAEDVGMGYNRVRKHSTLGYLSPVQFELAKSRTFHFGESFKVGQQQLSLTRLK